MRRYPFGAVATLCVALFLLATVCAQESTGRPHVGIPQDWSQRQILFSRAALLQHPNLLNQEPRVLHQAMQRWQAPHASISHRVRALTPPVLANQRDWNMALKGHISPNMFPAKFGFDPAAAPDCANDYVVFGTTAVGVTGGASNLVAFNNLYSGPGGLCGAAPMVLFAYNTSTVGGHIATSPVLSLDGTKIAFVESVTGSATFHVLTWAHEGAIAHAAAPNMTSLLYSPAATNNYSSPWVDYRDDVAYVGSDDSKIYKITGVFNGTPTLAGAPWPVTVGTNVHLTPPVLDRSRSVLMVGGSNGNLYQINTSTGALASLKVGGKGTNHGILGAPIVDVTNGTTFVVSSNDGANGGVLVQVDTASNTLLASASIGLASFSGTGIDIYQPAFSDSYYNDPNTGVVRLCGTGPADINPWQYAFGFNGGTLQPNAVFSQQLTTTASAPPAHCTGWTEFFNPNIGPTGTDFFYFGLTEDCTTPTGGFVDGCVVERVSDTVLNKATLNGGPSGIVVDNSSTAAQASSIYLMDARVNTAHKYTQNGLH